MTKKEKIYNHTIMKLAKERVKQLLISYDPGIENLKLDDRITKLVGKQQSLIDAVVKLSELEMKQAAMRAAKRKPYTKKSTLKDQDKQIIDQFIQTIAEKQHGKKSGKTDQRAD